MTRQESLDLYLDALFPDGSEGYFVSAYLTKQHTNGTGRYEGNFHEIGGKWPQDRERLTKSLLERSETDDAYLAPYLRTLPNRKKDASDPLPSQVLRCDLDGREVTKEEADALGAMVVASGRGSHVYVKLTEALEGDDLESWNRRLCAYLGTGAEKWEANAVLRPPGTLNHKPRVIEGKDPARTRIKREESKCWTLDDLDALLPQADESARHEPSDAEPLADLDTDSLPSFIRMMLNEEPGDDRSLQTSGFVRECVDAGLDDPTTIAATLLHRPTRARGKKESEVVADARRLLGKARQERSERSSNIIPAPTQGYEVAKLVHRDVWEGERLARVGGLFWEWTGTHWREPHPDALARSLYEWLSDKVYETKRSTTQYPTTRGRVDDLRAALSAIAHRDQEHGQLKAARPFARSVPLLNLT